MKPLNILIVDDQPLNLKLLKAQLEAEGHTVAEAPNGVEALSRLDSMALDVIISDILMPVMDGYRLCGKVRSSERHRNLPFIFYTATYTSPADEELCLQLGANRYLRKPVHAWEMLAAIEEALDSSYRPPQVTLQEQDILKEYSERLIFKLEQKNAELANLSDRLKVKVSALDAATDAIVIADAKGVISWVNRAFSAGRSESAIGMALRDVIELPEDISRETYWKTHAEHAWRGESATRLRDGALHFDEVIVTPVFDSGDAITNFVAVIRDATRRKETEEQLRETHERLHEFLDRSPAILYALKIEGESITPRYVSENIVRLLGVSQEETLSMEWWLDSIHPDDRAGAYAGMSEAINEGDSHTEYRLRHRDGTYHWVHDARRLVRDASGRPSEIVGATTDITERRQAQDDLRESERRFQSMLSNLELITMMLDGQARISYCNDHLLRLTGWKREELLGRDWFETFIPPELSAELHKTFSNLLSDLPEAWHHENEILTRSGKRLLIRWNNSCLRSPSGEVIGMASIGEDVSERRDLERQMLRAQRLESLGTLAGGIAHDLNNLLMPILMGATLLRRLGASEQALRAVDNIERSVKRGSDLVKQVLLFAGGGETSRSPVSLKDIAQELEAILVSTFPKNIQFEISIPTSVRAAMGNITQLTQVLLNLCVNARDAMPQGGQISVTAMNTELSQDSASHIAGAASGPYVVLNVTDTGEGMAKETIDRIFDPFFTTKEKGKGTGLGLSTVQGIVASHGGFISVASDVGQGTTFKVYLPAATAPLSATIDDQPAMELPHGHGEAVLVVDDDSTVLSMTTQTLEAFGYRVIGAQDGAQAIGLYTRHRSDIALVLTDMAMPVIDGHALIAALTRIDPEVRIIAATGNIEAPHQLKIAKTGVKSILAKPYTADDLLRLVANTIAK
jgi:PAS domain S-box-containing protein